MTHPNEKAFWEKERSGTIKPSPIVLTIGHSTRTLEAFIVLLQAHGSMRVVDVRMVPRSRHNQQFNKTSLPNSLRKVGLRYVHLPELGGLRHARRDSVNSGWPNVSFPSYADYMQTPEFARASANSFSWRTRSESSCCAPKRCHGAFIVRFDQCSERSCE